MQPQLGRTSYFGFSFGGIITANLANRYRSLDLPKPRAIFLEDPHDGGLTGLRRAGARRLAGGHPVEREAPVPLERRRRHLRAEQGGRRAATRSSRSSGTSRRATRTSCSPAPTRTATPALLAPHGVCAAPRGPRRRLRLELLLEGLGRAAQLRLRGTDCRYALGDTRQHRSNGRWSDGMPIAPLKIQDAAPIRPSTSRRRPAAVTSPRAGTARRAAVGVSTSSNSGTGSPRRC